MVNPFINWSDSAWVNPLVAVSTIVGDEDWAIVTVKIGRAHV